MGIVCEDAPDEEIRESILEIIGRSPDESETGHSTTLAEILGISDPGDDSEQAENKVFYEFCRQMPAVEFKL